MADLVWTLSGLIWCTNNDPEIIVGWKFNGKRPLICTISGILQRPFFSGDVLSNSEQAG